MQLRRASKGRAGIADGKVECTLRLFLSPMCVSCSPHPASRQQDTVEVAQRTLGSLQFRSCFRSFGQTLWGVEGSGCRQTNSLNSTESRPAELVVEEISDPEQVSQREGGSIPPLSFPSLTSTGREQTLQAYQPAVLRRAAGLSDFRREPARKGRGRLLDLSRHCPPLRLAATACCWSWLAETSAAAAVRVAANAVLQRIVCQHPCCVRMRAPCGSGWRIRPNTRAERSDDSL